MFFHDSVHQPPLIRTPVAWNGTSEYLYILANHHGSGHRQVYESQPWFHKLVPQKASAAPKVLNLRKRKPNPGAFREPSKSPGPDDEDAIEEPPRKKLKSKPATSPEPPVNPGKASSDDAESSSTNKTQKPTSAPSPMGNSHENTSQQPEPADQDNIPTDESTQTRMSTRNRRGGPSQTPSTSSRASSMSPMENPTTVSSSHSRNRSISYASSQTAVASSSSQRSASVLSASTAVDGHGPAKSKQLTLDNGDHQDPKDVSDTQSDEEGMVTRGRASRARVDSSKAAAELDSDRTKSGKQAPSAMRNGVQKAKRKP